MKNNIPTAEEFWKEKYKIGTDIPLNIMTEFAKLHVEVALKEASENASLYLHNDTWRNRSDIKTVECSGYNASIDKDSIRNAYPLENIK